MQDESRKWIFIRGLGRHSLHWTPFFEEFKRNFPRDEVEFLDLRGNGVFAHSPSLLSIRENVRDLRSRSEFLKKYGSVYLMTISLGSMVGTEWAHLYPEEISGFVAMNTSDRGSSYFFERMRPQNFLKLMKILGRAPSNQEIEKKILEMSSNERADSQELIEKFSQIPPTSRSNFMRQLVAASTYEFPKHKPRTEILLLCSESDQLVNPNCTKNIAAMWTLKPHIHPTAGHDLPLDDPQWVCQEIHNWLD